MPLLLIIVFVGVFAVFALVLVASGAGASQRTKETLARLESTLAAGRKADSSDEIVDLRKQELFSAVPWLNRWLLRLEIAPRLRILLYQANLKWTVGVLLLMSLICFLIPAYLVYLRTGTIVLGLLIGLLLGGSPIFYVLAKRKQRFGRFEQGLPEAIDLMVSALRAGHSLVAALGLVANESPDPIGPEFKICFEEQNYGLDLRTAMDNLVARVPLQDLRIIVTAILIQRSSGGNLAEVLDKAAYLVRERFRLRRQVRTHTAQGRLTGWILTFLPVVLGIALYLVNPDTMSLLWRRDFGRELLWSAAVMTIIGAFIIRKIVNMEV
ncbi:MAG TPA: type II secretion system F family protein [Acidobacteriaceae bacterium]|jgi:tight adherence protein B